MTLERQVERDLVCMVNRLGGVCLKWVCPGWAGVPDRIILLPGGLICFAELKRPYGGKLSKQQIWWHRKLRDLGFDVWVIKTRTDIDDLEVVLRLERY